ncbi:keratin, type I cytoskeletal 9-like [Macrobrachium rosenbergii]|uniref:keratin, type I cytoskeletal 9-like n=1 Tax=Macrobrachium rosenbergii TaxID=79674 RepID=UPI0034D3928D
MAITQPTSGVSLALPGSHSSGPLTLPGLSTGLFGGLPNNYGRPPTGVLSSGIGNPVASGAGGFLQPGFGSSTVSGHFGGSQTGVHGSSLTENSGNVGHHPPGSLIGGYGAPQTGLGEPSAGNLGNSFTSGFGGSAIVGSGGLHGGGSPTSGFGNSFTGDFGGSQFGGYGSSVPRSEGDIGLNPPVLQVYLMEEASEALRLAGFGGTSAAGLGSPSISSFGGFVSGTHGGLPGGYFGNSQVEGYQQPTTGSFGGSVIGNLLTQQPTGSLTGGYASLEGNFGESLTGSSVGSYGSPSNVGFGSLTGIGFGATTVGSSGSSSTGGFGTSPGGNFVGGSLGSFQGQTRPVVPILEDQREEPYPSGIYRFRYATGNGIVRQEEGYPDGGMVSQQGGWSFTFPDGTPAIANYVADGNGFHIDSNLLPIPPPPPPHAIAQIEKAQQEDAAAAAAGYQLSEDGTYEPIPGSHGQIFNYGTQVTGSGSQFSVTVNPSGDEFSSSGNIQLKPDLVPTALEMSSLAQETHKHWLMELGSSSLA